MAPTINILITGVNRGLGKALMEAYLARPNHIVIGSVGDKSTAEVAALQSLPAAEGSTLKLVQIDSESATDALAEWKAHFVAGYGIAKAAMNWTTVSVHCGSPWLVAFAAHPGFVQTESGNRSARAIGLEKAPDELEKSISSIVKLIDGATRETTSGKFWHAIEGSVIPW